MPFGTKNIGATYQKLVNTMFTDLIGKKVEAYIHEMVVKTTKCHNRIQDLQDIFSTLL